MVCQNLHAAGPVCFNYKTFEHPGLAAVGANRALVNYNHALIALRNAAIPPLAAGAYQLEISKRRVLVGGAWLHAIHVIVGGPLNYQQAAFMTIDRTGMGIPVVFQHPAEIAAIAAGNAIPVVAFVFGWTVPNLTRYLNRSLGGGGYRNTPLAAALYRLRFNPPQTI